jgi:drug/metabolite transporter (DMT)-like permease
MVLALVRHVVSLPPVPACDAERVTLVVALAVLAAFLFAAAASLQQHSARRLALATEAGGEPVVPVLRLLRGLARSRLWLLGWVTNLVGFFAQAAALHVGSVAVVQPVLVTQLLFTLPLASAWARRWPVLRDWVSGTAVCAGVALFLAWQQVDDLEGAPDRGRLLLAMLLSLVAVAALSMVASRRSGREQAFLFSVAAGLCFAQSAVLMKLTTTDLLGRGVPATAADWPGYCLAASTALGLLLEQQAFTAGALPVAIAAMTITNPTASYVLGVLAFHEDLPTGPGAVVGLGMAGVLLLAGVVGLAHGPAGQQDPEAPRSSARQRTGEPAQCR